MTDPSLIDRENWDEHYVRRGDPSKPTYYIIRHKWPTTGLFALFNVVAASIRIALQNGWLPVVDMQNYPNPYLSPDKFGKENAWEYYFEQPLRIGLEQAYNSENIILSNGLAPKYMPWSGDFYGNKVFYMEWRMLVKLGLLKVKPSLMEEILAIHDKLFAPQDRVLGVLLRGTDYVSLKPYGHSIPPHRISLENGV